MALAGDCVITGAGGNDPTGESDWCWASGAYIPSSHGLLYQSLSCILIPCSTSVGPDGGGHVSSGHGGENGQKGCLLARRDAYWPLETRGLIMPPFLPECRATLGPS